MKRASRRLAASIGFVALIGGAPAAFAQTAPTLGAAQSFAVLGGSTVTNTGPTVITGDLGVSPGTAVTGFPPGIVSGGTIHAGDALALQAQNSLTTAYNALASQTCTADLTGQDLGGKTLIPGVYCFASSAQLTGTLILDAQGSANPVFIFKIGTTLTTATNAVVVVTNGQNCNVFFQVGSSATLGTGSTIAGNILALTSITMNTSARLFGRALARNGAVTLDSSRTDASVCTAPPPPACPPIALSPATLPNGTVGAAYSQTITGSGGTAPYTFSVTAGALPAGLTLTAAGVLAGTPTSAGSSTFTVRGTDAAGCFAERSYTVVIAAAPPPPPTCPSITLSPTTLPNGTVGAAYSQTITGSGGTAPYTFGVTAGALPAGLTLTAAGVLAGTPTSAGSSTFTVRGTDANGCFAERSYTIVIAAAPPPPPTCPPITISPATLPNATLGVAYSQTITGSGGAAPYTFGVTAGALPVGMTLTAAGVLAGTSILNAVTTTFTVRATDANGCIAERSFTLVIAEAPPPPPTCPPITLSPATLPNGTVAAAYSQTITGSGGTAPYTFGVTAGALPAGLTLTAAGVLAGTPTTAGTSTFTIRGTDANGCFAERSFTLVIGAAPPPPPTCPPITLSPATLPNGTVAVAYSQTITGSGGTAPYTFGVTAGALPAGLTLTAAGVLAGTPTTAGTSTVTIRGTDANGCFREITYTLVIAAVPAPPPTCPPITLSPATLPNGTAGVAYTQTLTGSGGTGPYTFSVRAGALPPGITLTPAGALSGTPTVGGTSTVTIRGIDANGCFAERSFTLSITTAVPTLPQFFVGLLALGLAAAGYVRLRRRARTA